MPQVFVAEEETVLDVVKRICEHEVDSYRLSALKEIKLKVVGRIAQRSIWLAPAGIKKAVKGVNREFERTSK